MPQPPGVAPYTAEMPRQTGGAVAREPRPVRLRYGGRGSPWGLLGIGLALLVIGLSLGAPMLAPYDPVAVALDVGLQRPSAQHWLGTDVLGRDVWSRLLWAGRTSVSVATVIVLLTCTIGIGLGLVSGYAGGLIDDLAMRLADLLAALPPIILALAVIGTAGASRATLILALSLTGWTPYARLTRSLVLQTRCQEFVLAAHALGARQHRVLLRHVLPAVLGPLAVHTSLNVGGIILALAGLSVLGLGIQPPTPEWGAMLVEARPFLASAPHLVLPPGLAIFLVVLGCNALAERLADRW